MKKIQNNLKCTINSLKKETNIFEYLLWWVIRIALVVTLVMIIRQRIFIEGIFDIRIVQVSACILVTFVIGIFRFIFSSCNFFMGKVSFRCQTWINITVFFASFFGQGLDLYATMLILDKWVHFITGGMIVLIGNEILTATMRKGDRISPFTRTVSSMGLSYFSMIIWELVEFIFDYFWVDSALQRFFPDDIADCNDSFFIKLFGQSVNEGRLDSNGNVISHWQLYDTNLDLLYAFIACALVGLGLYIFLRVKEKKNMASEEKEEIKETINV